MRSKRTSKAREQDTALPSARVGGAGQPWRPWREVTQARGGGDIPFQQFIQYALMRGYVREVVGPSDGPCALELRSGERVWRATTGIVALALAGAEPDTPVPDALRALDE